MPKTFLAELIESQRITSFFLAKQIQVRQKRTGENYLSLMLSDRTGEVAAVSWESPTPEQHAIANGDIVKAQVQLVFYHGTKQLTICRRACSTSLPAIPPPSRTP